MGPRVEDFESCPHCNASFSFKKPVDGKCTFCGKVLIEVRQADSHEVRLREREKLVEEQAQDFIDTMLPEEATVSGHMARNRFQKEILANQRMNDKERLINALKLVVSYMDGLEGGSVLTFRNKDITIYTSNGQPIRLDIEAVARMLLESKMYRSPRSTDYNPLKTRFSDLTRFLR